LPSPEPAILSSWRPCVAARLPSSHAVGCSLEGSPACCRRIGLAIPPRGSSTSWSSHAGREPDEWLACLPRTSAPLQSVTRWTVAPSSDASGSLEVSPPTAQPKRDEPPLPELPPPGQSCVLAVPAGLDALLPSRSPRCVSTGRALGVLPSELDLAGIACASRRRFPSCDWLTASRYRSGLPTSGTTSPVPRPCPVTFRLRRVARVPGSPVPRARSPPVPDGGSGMASLQGFDPPAGWEPASVSPRSGGLLALLGVHPPWGIPLPGLGLLGRRTRPSPFGAGPRDAPGIVAPFLGISPWSGAPPSASSPVLR
jgi:hypothetical protein